MFSLGVSCWEKKAKAWYQSVKVNLSPGDFTQSDNRPTGETEVEIMMKAHAMMGGATHHNGRGHAP